MPIGNRGGSRGGGPGGQDHPPFEEHQNFIKRGKNVTCVCVKMLRFSS